MPPGDPEPATGRRFLPPGARILANAFLPGALAGTQIAGLLFFLNPHLPFEAEPVLQGIAFLSLLLGAVTSAVILPLTWRRPRRSGRLLPWSLTLVLAAAGVGAWIHASHYAFYLPSGINRRLLKTAIWLSLAAVICFYTALLHAVRQRPYGRRSQLLFVLMALASVYVLIERREAFKPRPGPVPRSTTFTGNPRPQLLLVGIDAATLDAILPLAEQGRLPFLKRMLAEGFCSRLTALKPPWRLPLWTTLATGKYPYRHGIVGERVFGARFLGAGESLSLLPMGIGFESWGTSSSRPVDPGARRVLALWEILARLEIPSALVGWPLLAPAAGGSPGAGIGLSERFFTAGGAEGSAWPAEVVERARLFRPPSPALDPDRTARFGPSPPATVIEALAGDSWREELSFFLLDQHPETGAFFVVLPGLREVSLQYFGAYSAVQFEGEQDSVTEEKANLLSAYYMYLDEFLAGLWERSRDPRLLVVVSVHGTEDDYGLRKAWRILSRAPAHRGYFNRAPAGVLMALGEGIRAEPRLGTAELVDLVPTLLYGLGFPVARDLDGAVLTEAFDTSFLGRQPLTFLPSYETFAVSEER